MPRMQPANGLSPAFRHMTNVLIKPFMLRKWLALGFVSLVAYSGGFHFNINVPGDVPPDIWAEPIRFLIRYWPALLLASLLIIGLFIVLMWVMSVLHFVYVDQIIRNHPGIRQPFRWLRGRGTSYFLWTLAYGLIFVLIFGLMVILPIVILFLMLPEYRTALIFIAVAWTLIIGGPLFVIAIIIDVLVRDFVTLAMYVRGVGILDGWRIVWPILSANVGGTAVYLLLLILIGLVTGVFAFMVTMLILVMMLFLAAPFAVIGYLIWTALDFTWTLPMIILVASIGFAFFSAFMYVASCAVQPASVFRRAYSLAVIGQTDPSLATIPTGMESAAEEPIC